MSRLWKAVQSIYSTEYNYFGIVSYDMKMLQFRCNKHYQITFKTIKMRKYHIHGDFPTENNNFVMVSYDMETL